MLLLPATDDYTTKTLGELLLTADLTPFVANRAQRSFEFKKGDTDHMYFSLLATQPGPREQKHLEFARAETQNQQYVAQMIQQSRMQMQLQPVFQYDAAMAFAAQQPPQREEEEELEDVF